MNWYYQKYENDCWLCALKNLLFCLGTDVEYYEILNLLNRRGLYTYKLAGFFTYIPLILADYGYKSEFYFSQKSYFYGEYLWNNMNLETLYNLVQDLKQKQDALYFLYQSIIQILDTSEKINLYFQSIDFYKCLSENKMILAHINADDYYGLTNQKDNHVILIIPKYNDYITIDPFEKKGMRNIPNWNEWKKKISKL